MSLNKAMVSSSRHDWGTPDEIFNPLNERYKFTIDLFASHTNALLPPGS